MTQLQRITLGMTALVVVIVVVGALAISQLDLNHHKARIERLALEQTGRQLQINGQVNATVFPWLGLTLQDVRMANAVDFAEPNFATVTASALQVEVLPLLFGKVNIKTLVLEGLSLNLKRSADGKTNWDDLLATTAVVETESEDNVLQEVEAGAPIIAALSVGELRVVDANINYTNDQASSYTVLNDLNLKTGAVVLSEPFTFESDFTLINSIGDGLQSAITVQGEAALDLANNIYRLQQLELTTESLGNAVPIEPLSLTINGDLVTNLNAQSVDITVSSGELAGVPISGEFHAAALQDNPTLTGFLSSGAFDAIPVIERLKPGLTERFGPNLLKETSVSARFEHSEDVLLIQEVMLSANDVDVTGDFQIANLSSSGVISGRLQSSVFNPAPWAQSVGWSGIDSTMMQALQWSADVRQSGQLLSFKQINIQLDDTTITGDVEISDINAHNPPVTFAIAVDQIDLDRYLSHDEALIKASEKVAPENAASDTSAAQDSEVDTESAARIPIEVIKQLDLRGEVTLGQLTLMNATLQNAVIPIKATDGRIEISEAMADLYAGSFFTTASLDVQSEEPLLTVASNLSGLQADAVLQDVLNQVPPLTGLANLNIDMLSRGLTWSELRERANGALSFRVTDGQLSGIDLTEELQRASRVLGNTGLAVDSNTAQETAMTTPFSEFSLSAVLADGVLQSDDLNFASPVVSLSGEGGVNLHTHQVDYLVHLTVTDALSDNNLLQRIAGVELSIPVRGPFTDLSIDLPRLLRNAFESDLIQEIKSRFSDWPDAPIENTRKRIESEKEALRQRVEQQQQQATEAVREQKQQAAGTAEEAKRALEKKLEEEKNQLKDRLQNNLKKGLNDLLGENE